VELKADEFDPFAGVTPEPPAPTVIVYEMLGSTVKLDVKYPPAPPPPALATSNPPAGLPPPPPPAITRYSMSYAVIVAKPKAPAAAAPILDRRGIIVL
jgi:hypothetical protein